MIRLACLSLHAPHSTPRKTTFRTSIPKLSHHERPSFAPRYLSYRNAKDAQSSAHDTQKVNRFNKSPPILSLSHPKIPHNFLTKNHDTPPSRLSHPQARPTPLTRLPTNIFAHFFAKSRHNRPSFEKNAVPLNTKPTFLALGAQNKVQKVILSDEATTAEQGA